MTTPTEWRELCAELLKALEIQLDELASTNRLCKRARAALAQSTPEGVITFHESRDEVIRIDSQGFHYRSELIEDAGQAHQLMMTFLQRHTSMHPEVVERETAQPEAEGVIPESELADMWNQQADSFNQWESLDSGEQLEWAQTRAIARCARPAIERTRPQPEWPKLEPRGCPTPGACSCPTVPTVPPDLIRALEIAEAGLADIGDSDREPDDDLVWAESRAASCLPRIRAVLARWGRPAIKPVPVSERPWEHEGWCDANGKCWWWNPAANTLATPWWSYEPWEWVEDAAYSLPHYALPVPQQEDNR